ncbi:MAG: dipeptide ABC transporter ATP-binding protein [Alphaproteobacteria bacterium]|nr:dipeptide ABC transporter ATP-binding protein [Alphaproteobacteria bacterium]
MTGQPMLSVRDLTRHFTLPREGLTAPPRHVYALNGVSFDLAAGRSLGIVGESGCGKSTLARIVMALDKPTAGRVELLGEDIAGLDARQLRARRRHFQMVFQDPYGSLDPRQQVGRIVGEPLDVLEPTSKAERRQRIAEALASVGLRPTDADKYPHEFSGGQRQRIAIARALITRPSLIVADEPVSALDVSVQAQVLNLLQELQDRFGVAYLFISHDLAVVEYVCDEVAVMYLGRIVEQGPTGRVLSRPYHPYTQALLDAVPRAAADARPRKVLQGNVGSQIKVATGCPFADRCPRVEGRCHDSVPPLRVVEEGHLAACHLA